MQNIRGFIMSAIQSSPFLRRVLLLDAVSSGAMGLLLLTCGGFLASVLNLPVELLNEAGIVLLPFALILAFLGSRARLMRAAVWAVIVVNAVWVIDSCVLLLSAALSTKWVEPAVLGYIFVAGQAAFVALMAELEFIGLRRSTAVAALARA
jgi:hypothetical protein